MGKLAVARFREIVNHARQIGDRVDDLAGDDEDRDRDRRDRQNGEYQRDGQRDVCFAQRLPGDIAGDVDLHFGQRRDALGHRIDGLVEFVIDEALQRVRIAGFQDRFQPQDSRVGGRHLCFDLLCQHFLFALDAGRTIGCPRLLDRGLALAHVLFRFSVADIAVERLVRVIDDQHRIGVSDRLEVFERLDAVDQDSRKGRLVILRGVIEGSRERQQGGA